LRNLPENDGLRMTYDRGRLEIMSPSPRHEGFAHILGRLTDAWTEELNIPILGLRTMTCKREDIERGFEPDNCYYVRNEPRMWDKTDVDFLVDPPPDLALEIEITRGLVGKMAIYESFGVPELWQFDGRKLQVVELAEDGHYRAPVELVLSGAPHGRSGANGPAGRQSARDGPRARLPGMGA
jgi:Uma2 family endonuclease